ncbi:perforin-1-like [Amia ocellicauda]|uniref:perforin-1-like n=1 Tax=Amia ocellicauda TaxID=2972642 RepID=UPI0034644EB1
MMIEGVRRITLLYGLLQILSRPVVLGTLITGTPVQCQEAEFVPGYNLAGEGFDIVKMERKGAYVINMEDWQKANGTCTLKRNRYIGGKLQKIPLAIVDWRALSNCKMKVSSTIYESSESLVNDTTSNVENNWKVGLDVNVNPNVKVGVALGGTHSRAANYAMKKSKEDKYSFTSHQVDCKFYRYRLVTNPPIHNEFLESVKLLPKRYSSETKEQYRSLIDTYGTHFTRHVQLGGKVSSITSIKSCQATMNGMTDTAVKDCLDVEASATIAMTGSVKTEAHHCKSLLKKMNSAQSFSSMFSDRHSEIIGGQIDTADLLFSSADPTAYKNWLQSIKTMPDVVSYALIPLHTLIPIKDPVHNGLKQALVDYILENALLKKCSEKCEIGTKSSARDCCACVCNANKNLRSNCCPAAKGLAELNVYDLRAEKLYGDLWTETDGSVRVSYGEKIRRTGIVNNNDNPIWRERLEFVSIKIDMASKLTFQVYDEDSVWNSDLLGECSFTLKQGTVKDICTFQHGTFFFTYNVQCAPSLGGSECNDYISSPMSPSLSKKFQSRNGIFAIFEIHNYEAKTHNLKFNTNVTQGN